MTTTTTDKTKNPKQKRIMIASIIIAATIALGSTFAWFTSKDSVTNRLTASSDYGVSITETFTPPETWIPGQTINKDVSAVNTGNISAFVKLTLSNKLSVTTEEAATATANQSGTYTVPSDAITLNSTTNEVASTKAGGVLVWTTNSTDTSKMEAVTSTAGTGTNFTPSGAGLYVFRRTVTSDELTTNEGDSTDYKYDGFYYDGSSTYYKITNITPTVDSTSKMVTA